jgi:hypothetical protein
MVHFVLFGFLLSHFELQRLHEAVLEELLADDTALLLLLEDFGQLRVEIFNIRVPLEQILL